MTFPKISANKILILAILVVAVAGYFIFKSDGEDQEPLTTTETGAAASIGQELVTELTRLKALSNMKGEIFQDPAFMSLNDFTQTVVPQPVGRNNPFAPLGAGQ